MNEFPEAKNYAVVNGKKIGFAYGQNIRIGEKWHIPEEGIRLISTEGPR